MSSADLSIIASAFGLSPEKAAAVMDVMRIAVREEIRQETAHLDSRLGDRLLTRKQVAEQLGCSPKTIQRREQEGLIRSVPGPGRPLYHPAEVDRLRASLGTPAAGHATLGSPRERPRRRNPSAAWRDDASE
ncbi:MAG: MerR family transcriptional regulator [Bacteroidota bacterium]